ncbi:MAG: hypothetical protein ACPG19_14775 [Saprospiraceae bacterium]
MKKGFLYATKIWLLAVFAAPLLIGIYVLYQNTSHLSGLNMDWEALLPTYGLTLAIGGLGTIPVWLFFGVLVGAINELKYSILHKKIFIQIISIILCVIAFGVFKNMIGNTGKLEIVALSIPYLIMLSVGIWVLKLKENSTVEVPLSIEEHLVE